MKQEPILLFLYNTQKCQSNLEKHGHLRYKENHM